MCNFNWWKRMFINHYKTFNVWNSNNSEIIIDKFDDHFQVKYCFFFICKFRISLINCDLFILEFYSSWLSCRAQVTNLQELYSGLVLYWGQSTNTCHHLYGLCNLQVRSIAHVHYTCIKNLPLEIWVDINLMNWYSIIQSSRTCHNSYVFMQNSRTCHHSFGFMQHTWTCHHSYGFIQHPWTCHHS